MILNKGEEDKTLMVVLEGSVNKIVDGVLVETYEKDSVIGEKMIAEPFNNIYVRNYDIISNTDSKILTCSKISYNTVL